MIFPEIHWHRIRTNTAPHDYYLLHPDLTSSALARLAVLCCCRRSVRGRCSLPTGCHEGSFGARRLRSTAHRCSSTRRCSLSAAVQRRQRRCPVPSRLRYFNGRGPSRPIRLVGRTFSAKCWPSTDRVLPPMSCRWLARDNERPPGASRQWRERRRRWLLSGRSMRSNSRSPLLYAIVWGPPT